MYCTYSFLSETISSVHSFTKALVDRKSPCKRFFCCGGSTLIFQRMTGLYSFFCLLYWPLKRGPWTQQDLLSGSHDSSNDVDAKCRFRSSTTTREPESQESPQRAGCKRQPQTLRIPEIPCKVDLFTVRNDMFFHQSSKEVSHGLTIPRCSIQYQNVSYLFPKGITAESGTISA